MSSLTDIFYRLSSNLFHTLYSDQMRIPSYYLVGSALYNIALVSQVVSHDKSRMGQIYFLDAQGYKAD
jgi:hypothetical protein